MPTSVEINGKTFVPVKQAAENFGYSRDHITRLAKAKKIKATQSGRAWLVSENSLQNYFSDQQSESEIRKNLLSSERQVELQIRSRLSEATVSENNTLKGSGLSAGVLSAALLGVCFWLVGNITPSSFSSTAAVFSASGNSATLALEEPGTIQPVFTNKSEVWIGETGRKVQQPEITAQWVLISHD